MRSPTLLLVVALLTPAAAFPCGNAVYLDTEDAARLVSRVERAVEGGKYALARRLSAGIALELPSRQYNGASAIADAGLRRRLTIAAATAAARSGDAKRAIDLFRGLDAATAEDPLIQSRLGEALSHRADTREEAKALLEALAARDLVIDAHAYAALARLRRAAGESEAAARAEAACTKLGGHAKLCGAPKAARKGRPGSTS